MSNHEMTEAKQFGKSDFVGGDYDKQTYYLKELQTNMIKKKLDLINNKLGDINKIVTLLQTKRNDLKQQQAKHGHN